MSRLTVDVAGVDDLKSVDWNLTCMLKAFTPPALPFRSVCSIDMTDTGLPEDSDVRVSMVQDASVCVPQP